MIVKTILVKKHSFGSFEVDSIGPVSETANDIRNYPNSKGWSSWQLGCGGISESGSALYYDGALSVEKNGTRQCAPVTTMVAPGDITIRLDLSQGNAIYSDAVTTVRPEALRAYCLIRYS